MARRNLVCPIVVLPIALAVSACGGAGGGVGGNPPTPTPTPTPTPPPTGTNTSLLAPLKSETFKTIGSVTPWQLLSKTGTASYSGIVVGQGGTLSQSTGLNYYDVIGTSSLSVDFSSSNFTGVLALTGKNRLNGSIFDFGSFGFAGTLQSNVTAPGVPGNAGFFGNQTGTGYTGQWKGLFYGLQGQEFGGIFGIQFNGVNGIQSGGVNGATVGKKN